MKKLLILVALALFLAVPRVTSHAVLSLDKAMNVASIGSPGQTVLDWSSAVGAANYPALAGFDPFSRNDIRPAAAPAPESRTFLVLFLLGSALIGLGNWGRKKFRK